MFKNHARELKIRFGQQEQTERTERALEKILDQSVHDLPVFKTALCWLKVAVIGMKELHFSAW